MMDDENNVENSNAEDYEIYFVAREQDEETEEESKFIKANSLKLISMKLFHNFKKKKKYSNFIQTHTQLILLHQVSFDSFSDYNQSNDSSRTSEHRELIEYESHESEQNESTTSVGNERRISYDRNLPAHHSYLGNQFEELTGRVVLEEETIVTIPLLCLPGVVLIPGQLLPLQFQGSYFLSTIRTIIEGNKIFGLVPNYINRNVNLKNVYNNVRLDRLGTIVEVRSYGTEDEGSILKVS